MELVPKKRLMLFAGQGNLELSTEIARCLRVPLGEVELSTFANGELYARYCESVRGRQPASRCRPVVSMSPSRLIIVSRPQSVNQ